MKAFASFWDSSIVIFTGLSARERKASGEVFRKQHDSLDHVREDLLRQEGFALEVVPQGLIIK